MKIKRYTRPEEYEVAIFRDVMVPARGGIRLAVDLYLPARDGAPVKGRFPAILDLTCYGKTQRALVANDPEFFAKRGYVFVFGDSRGHYSSEGEFYIYLNEGRDGFDIVEWIARQPWSNGVVATSGYSYDAATQHSTARENPPHLKAMFPAFGTSSYHLDCEGTGGAFRLAHNLIYTMNHAMRDKRALENPAIYAWLAECDMNKREWFKRPLSKHIEIFKDVPMAQRWYSDWVEHQDYDDYWRQNGYCFEGYYDRFPDVPVYYFGGAWDWFERGTLVNYVELSETHKSPTFLMYGPWRHGPSNALVSWAGDVDFGPDSVVDWNEVRLRFYDQFIMGMDTGLLDEPPVKIFVMDGSDGRKNEEGRMNHGGRWRFEEAWPLPQTEFINYYLHSDGTLNPELPPRDSPPRKYSFDPRNPVPMIGGGYVGMPDTPGPRDQVCTEELQSCKDVVDVRLPLSSRPDILAYSTPPLEQDLEVVGPLIVKLWASSSAVDTDFTAKLIDVYPPNEDYPHGYAMYLIDSIIRARYRESLEKQVLMEPGEIYEFTIDLWATYNLFQAGHRVRLDISSSNYPTYDVNPNTGEKIGYHTRIVIAENTIYHDRKHSSHIILPIIP